MGVGFDTLTLAYVQCSLYCIIRKQIPEDLPRYAKLSLRFVANVLHMQAPVLKLE